MKKVYLKKTGFTLVEVIIASTIGAFVALVAVGSLNAISSGAEMINVNIDTAGEIRFASKIISCDLLNLYRDIEPEKMKLIGIMEETEDGNFSSRLTFYAVSRVKARTGEPESDVYEVEYSLVTWQGRSALMRRLWPNPDEDSRPGGVLAVIAENIDTFVIKYFDGSEWLLEWPEEMRTVPELVEVNIATRQTETSNLVMENFIINFSRTKGVDAFDSVQYQSDSGYSNEAENEN